MNRFAAKREEPFAGSAKLSGSANGASSNPFIHILSN